MNKHRLHAYYGLLLIASIIFGIASPLGKYILEYLPAEVFLTYRLAISAIIGAILFVFHSTKLPKHPPTLILIFVHSFLTVITFLFGFNGLRMTGALNTALIESKVRFLWLLPE